ncbi:hypothetical protein SAMN04487843_105112 [Methylobacterium sp. ap11]|uniref:hypothetical protein n=1 Tax=Methylobacterium sp. ap11 TaxID=1761799 RepID=UPI0008B659F4|nr:hypothetical protein [Methylobacterium sp. ap11]SEO94070.1 hypothetical protein SAMN04487843_105112 [Methylobacterium sp. ap11]
MQRTILKGMTEAEMAKHIAQGIENRLVIEAAPDPEAKLAEIIDLGDFVYAVWVETDKRKPKISGHALALLKGRPLMQSMIDSGSSAPMAHITIMLDNHSSAYGACARYGDEAEFEAS